MHIKKSQVETRKAQLMTEREKLIANLAAYNGALEDCDYWLSILENNESEATSRK